MERRDFVAGCAATAALALLPDALARQGSATPHRYARARLTDEDGEPLRAAALKPQQNYVFSYPYAGTPCFLLDLGRPLRREVRLDTHAGESYIWKGGVGPGASIVAYSAICSHRLMYPTKQVNFISFRDQPGKVSVEPNRIVCCGDHSVYDPAEGARVVAGPAPQPLATILLEYEPASDGLTAVGTFGGEMFEEFFRRYAFKLALEHGGQERAHKAVAGATVVAPLAHYCRQNVTC